MYWANFRFPLRRLGSPPGVSLCIIPGVTQNVKFPLKLEKSLIDSPFVEQVEVAESKEGVLLRELIRLCAALPVAQLATLAAFPLDDDVEAEPELRARLEVMADQFIDAFSRRGEAAIAGYACSVVENYARVARRTGNFHYLDKFEKALDEFANLQRVRFLGRSLTLDD